MEIQRKREWWLDFFGDFRPFFDTIPQRRTNALVRFILKELPLRSGQSFLDCPCGIGRVALPLARQGIQVTGVDIEQSYLDELDKKAARRKLTIPTYREDMRRISFREEFDAAGNLWTSFGFFEKESDNRLALKKAWQALTPGGRFIMSVINRDWIIAHFQTSDWSEIGDVRILEKRRFDYERSATISEWRFVRNGKEQVYEAYIRMYSYHELKALFESVGFVDVVGYGSYDREPISRESRMMYLLATKKG